MTSFTPFPITYGVLAPAQLAKSTLFITENKSHIKMLHDRDPKMEPWRLRTGNLTKNMLDHKYI